MNIGKIVGHKFWFRFVDMSPVRGYIGHDTEDFQQYCVRFDSAFKIESEFVQYSISKTRKSEAIYTGEWPRGEYLPYKKYPLSFEINEEIQEDISMPDKEITAVDTVSQESEFRTATMYAEYPDDRERPEDKTIVDLYFRVNHGKNADVWDGFYGNRFSGIQDFLKKELKKNPNIQQDNDCLNLLKKIISGEKVEDKDIITLYSNEFEKYINWLWSQCCPTRKHDWIHFSCSAKDVYPFTVKDHEIQFLSSDVSNHLSSDLDKIKKYFKTMESAQTREWIFDFEWRRNKLQERLLSANESIESMIGFLNTVWQGKYPGKSMPLFEYVDSNHLRGDETFGYARLLVKPFFNSILEICPKKPMLGIEVVLCNNDEEFSWIVNRFIADKKQQIPLDWEELPLTTFLRMANGKCKLKIKYKLCNQNIKEQSYDNANDSPDFCINFPDNVKNWKKSILYLDMGSVYTKYLLVDLSVNGAPGLSELSSALKYYNCTTNFCDEFHLENYNKAAIIRDAEKCKEFFVSAIKAISQEFISREIILDHICLSFPKMENSQINFGEIEEAVGENTEGYLINPKRFRLVAEHEALYNMFVTVMKEITKYSKNVTAKQDQINNHNVSKQAAEWIFNFEWRRNKLRKRFTEEWINSKPFIKKMVYLCNVLSYYNNSNYLLVDAGGLTTEVKTAANNTALNYSMQCGGENFRERWLELINEQQDKENRPHLDEFFVLEQFANEINPYCSTSHDQATQDIYKVLLDKIESNGQDVRYVIISGEASKNEYLIQSIIENLPQIDDELPQGAHSDKTERQIFMSVTDRSVPVISSYEIVGLLECIRKEYPADRVPNWLRTFEIITRHPKNDDDVTSAFDIVGGMYYLDSKRARK